MDIGEPRYELCAVLSTSVTLKRCDELTRVKKNNELLCLGCKSPKRRCSACVAQNLDDELVWVVPGKSLCVFHLKNSSTAVREPQNTEFIWGVEQRSVLKKTEPGAESGPKPKPYAKNLSSEVKEHLQDLANQISEEDILNIARVMPSLHPTKILTIEGLAQGLMSDDLATFSRIDSKSLFSRISTTYMQLGMGNLPQGQDLNTYQKGLFYRLVLARVLTAYKEVVLEEQ